ncbi:hypothetical protein GLAREA_12991 [Glarea lozoyensis ATCC 20868]|uniref:Uncharacterized protein n=1 Tax=Glarea lozoyensis (strain ATCC 20868 / MF5171) TaxID=1116229 RepID=S3DV52_GLAL2|nr:uncharacterized protein GLAREA_12991 [Glarea lozoyensis ATCC 20868]EPE30268.1 hypothetical protein GLAREA_12991 [Glarea lozoyensis ATCC 20868]
MSSFLDNKSTSTHLPAPFTTTTSPRRSRTSKALRRTLTLLLLALIFYLYKDRLPFYPQPHSAPIHYDASDDASEWENDPIPAFEPLKRYSLDYGRAACWQDDGVWILRLSPVEMSALGLNRFADTNRTLDLVDEDAFCKRLRMFGASFWELPPRWPEGRPWCYAITDCVEPTRKVSVKVGYPESGGVWWLDTTHTKLLSDALFPKSRGLSKALTMGERCEVIESLGGRFCEDVEECPELDVLMGGVLKVYDDDW